MIKLKYLLSEIKSLNLNESRRLDLNKLEDAAEYLIRQTWRFMDGGGCEQAEKYLEYEVFMWMDNEMELQRLKESFAEKFFPGDEAQYDKLDNVISSKLEQFEREHHQQLKKKIGSDDPLEPLKHICRRVSYEKAKRQLYLNSLGGCFKANRKVDDDEADEIFTRLYKNAMGETIYGDGTIKNCPRLSDIKKTIIPSDEKNKDHRDEYTNNIFLSHYAGYRANNFPYKVVVYRGVNNPNATIRPGDFVTFDKKYAYDYRRSKFGVILSDILNSSDLLVYKFDIGNSELIYWPEGHQIKKYEGRIPTFHEFWTHVNSM
jgi:hypothetical protein